MDNAFMMMMSDLKGKVLFKDVCIWLFNYLSIMKTIAFVSITLLTINTIAAKTSMPTEE